MWGMLFRGPKTSRRTLVALLMVAWCLGCLGQGQPATTSGGLTASHSTGPPMPRKLLQLEGAAGGATTMISNAGGDHLRSTGNAASPPNRPPPPALVASEEPELSMPAAPSSSDSSVTGSHTLLAVLLPMVAVVSILAFMTWALRRGLRQQPRVTQTSGTSRTLVRPVSLVNFEAELTSTESNLESGAGPSSSSNNSGNNPRRVLRVRSLRDVAQEWQQQLQRKSSSIWHSRAPARGLQQLRRLSIGSASAASGTLRVARTSMERARASSLFARRAAMLQPADSTPTEAAPAPTAADTAAGAAAAAAAEDEDELHYARLAPVIPTLQLQYQQVCQELTKFDHEAGSHEQNGSSGADQAAREQLLLTQQQLQSQLLEVVQQLQGRALVTWEEEKLARDIWDTLNTAAGVSPALSGRPKRFPGLAPWLIAELPTWVHTPPAQPAPAAAPAAAGVPGATAAGNEEGRAEQRLGDGPTSVTFGSSLGVTRSHSAPTPGEVSQSSTTERSPQDCDASPCCAVCLDPLEAGDLLQRLPPCAHTFHAPCLAAWLANSATCPMCRTMVLPASQEPGEACC